MFASPVVWPGKLIVDYSGEIVSCIGVWRREGVREQSAGENCVPLEGLEVGERRL